MSNIAFNYNGVLIFFDSTGKFTAKVSGLDVRKPSLDAMKKHIDNAAKIAFKPFTAIADIRHDETPIKGAPDYTRVEVVGIIKSTSRYGTGSAFVVKRHSKQGDHTDEATCVLYEDTAANLALLKAEDHAKEEKRRAEAKHDREINEIVKQQKRLNANNFTRSKP